VTVAIFEPSGRLMWALPIIGRPLHAGQHLLVESTP